MNILLLGGSGLLGGYFQQVFKAQNISFIAPSSSEFDITDPKSIESFFQKNPGKFSHIVFAQRIQM